MPLSKKKDQAKLIVERNYDNTYNAMGNYTGETKSYVLPFVSLQDQISDFIFRPMKLSLENNVKWRPM